MRRAVACLATAAVAIGALALGAGVGNAETVVPDGGVVIEGSTPQVERGIDVAHDVGARWVSMAASWEALEPAPDSYRTPGGPGAAAWDDLGTRLAYAASRGMNVELRFANAPEWASGRSGVSDDPPTPAHLADYASFLFDLATRFGGQIAAYSPWNEPNRPAFWKPTDPDAFTALQKAAYLAIKGADPTATVLYGPVVGRYASQNSGYSFLRRSYALGAKGSFDAIGWTGYPGGAPESPGPVENGVPAGSTLPAQLYLRGIIDQFDPGRKVWIMELGWSTCGSSCDASPANGVSESQQADYLTRAFAYRRRYLADYVDRIFWYDLRDLSTTPTDWFGTHGLLRNDFTPKPALTAFTALGIAVPSGSGRDQVGSLGTASTLMLPVAAARLLLPPSARNTTSVVALGKPRLTARRGILRLVIKVRLAGGRSKVRIEGYRSRRWRLIATTQLRRSGTIRIRFRDRGFLGVRVRATLPGRPRFRVARLVRIPVRLR